MAIITSKIISYRLSLFILFCGFLGGTSQGIYGPKILIYAVSIILITFVLLTEGFKEIWREDKYIINILICMIGYGLLQLIPLPAWAWTNVPGRADIADKFTLLKLAKPWLPLASNAQSALKSLLAFLPVVAVYLLVSRLASRREVKMAILTIMALGVASLILGTIQVIDPIGHFYFYEKTNAGFGVGIFSNINHQATLMGVGLAFSLYFILANRIYSGQNWAKVAFPVLALIFFMGLLVNGSSSAYVIIPVILLAIGSYLFTRKVHGKNIVLALGFLLLLIILTLDLLIFDKNLSSLIKSIGGNDSHGRQQIFANSFDVFRQNIPFGTGLGSYKNAYAQQETIDEITNAFVQHAHNDYLEIMVEYGLFGAGLIVAILYWWAQAWAKVLRNTSAKVNYAAPAAIAILVIMTHSCIDYPLRTITISVILGFCLGIITINKVKPEMFD